MPRGADDQALIFQAPQGLDDCGRRDAVIIGELVQDNQFDLDNWLPERLGARIGRAVAPFMISGTGTAQPLGIMTNMAIGVTGATGETLVPKYASLVNMYASIDTAYIRPGATAWVTSPSGLAALRNVMDSQARPLIQPDLQVGTDGSRAPFSLLGYPIILDPQIAVPAANAVSMFFGSLKDAYLIRTVQDTFTLRLTERYADFGLVGYISYLRMDGRVITQAAVKSLQAFCYLIKRGSRWMAALGCPCRGLPPMAEVIPPYRPCAGELLWAILGPHKRY
jgi:HK97 family phage major capsid protein